MIFEKKSKELEAVLRENLV